MLPTRAEIDANFVVLSLCRQGKKYFAINAVGIVLALNISKNF